MWIVGFYFFSLENGDSVGTVMVIELVFVKCLFFVFFNLKRIGIEFYSEKCIF